MKLAASSPCVQQAGKNGTRDISAVGGVEEDDDDDDNDDDDDASDTGAMTVNAVEATFVDAAPEAAFGIDAFGVFVAFGAFGALVAFGAFCATGADEGVVRSSSSSELSIEPSKSIVCSLRIVSKISFNTAPRSAVF